MPATRLLVVADSKMLAALSNGLREGGAFDVAVASLAEPAAAQAAAAESEAVVLFYGGPLAVQALAAKLRDRGGRLVAVLQASQHPQRDDCFRAGASDLLFMPMPKDQFVSRLQQSCALAFEAAAGATAEVTAVTRNATLKLEGAKVTVGGIESAIEAPFKAGDTVRLTFGPFQSWGLVARPAGPLQIRFAGLTADEDGQIRKWIDAGGPAAAAPAVAEPPAPPAAEAPPPPASAETPTAEIPLITPREVPAADGPRAAPASGPPPGFADRKPVRASTRPPAQRGPPPILTPPSVSPVAKPAAPPAAEAQPPADPAAAAPAETAPATPPASGEPPAAAPASAEPAAAAPAPGLNLFDEEKPAEAAAAPAVPTGPLWPTLYSPQSCRTAALFVLQDKSISADVSQAVANSARKVTGTLGAAEREGLQKAGSDSHFADALAVRVALDAASTEGARLYAAIPAPSVDAPAAATLLKLADDAATRLQKEANSAVTKGEVESLQLITAASAALSRDLLAFKETADRLRGLEAAPRLGAGALDPDLAIPGQPLRTQSNKPAAKQQQVRTELRDFVALDGMKSDTWKKIALGVGTVVLVVLAANAFYFSVPHTKVLRTESAGTEVHLIEYIPPSALVTVSNNWAEHAETELPKLLPVLREHEIKRATLLFPNGRIAASLDVESGKLTGMTVPSQPKPR